MVRQKNVRDREGMTQAEIDVRELAPDAMLTQGPRSPTRAAQDVSGEWTRNLCQRTRVLKDGRFRIVITPPCGHGQAWTGSPRR